MGGAVVSRCSPAITTETDNMKSTPLDEAAAKANPWKMTARQCMYMRLIGETGQAKQAAYTLGISTKSNSYPNRIRERMGLIGSDLRMGAERTRQVGRTRASFLRCVGVRLASESSSALN